MVTQREHKENIKRTLLEKDFGFKPKTTLRVGLREFAKWYKDFYMSDK